ncbi:MAG: permease prefix domain 1-containing protein, partial [Acidimicrobiia bacterium]
MERLESDIAEWRAFVAQGPAMDGRDVEELEVHLRDQVTDLTTAGLDEDEAFLIAVKRMGGIDELSAEFARQHSGRLWRQLGLAGRADQSEPDSRWVEMLMFAVAAAVAIQIVRLVAGFPGEESRWLVRNLGLLVIPFLAGFFARRRRLSLRKTLLTIAPFAVVGLVINLYPYTEGGSTEILVAAH